MLIDNQIKIYIEISQLELNGMSLIIFTAMIYRLSILN